MPYRFLAEKSIADIAFEATGKTFKELLESAADAVTLTMIKNLSMISGKTKQKFVLESQSAEMLVYKFLQHLVFLKDAEQILFNKFEIEIIPKNKKWKIKVTAYGEKINPAKHDLQTDVKAVTMHNFEVKETDDGWFASVTLDI